ncbi:MAG: hypothetical protein AB1775_13610 [Bacteroidota bacterium]
MPHCKKFFVLLLLIILFSPFPNLLLAQQKYDKSFYSGLFYISHYMTSDEYKQFAATHRDVETVDHIYETALKFFDGDQSETFFCLAFTFLPYNKILMRLPVIRTVVTIPLPSPPNSIFKEKLKNTPKKIFPDSPADDFGDKDKLAHFFANAFLHYDVIIFNLSEFLGIFVEYFEQGFFVQGGYDIRDLIANHIGEFYADMLKKNPNAKPSDAFLVYQLLYMPAPL